MRTPYKMKGYSYPGTSAAKSTDDKAKKTKKIKNMTEIDPKDLGNYQKPAEGFKWVMLDGKPSQVKI
jgi:hypothetical protein